VYIHSAVYSQELSCELDAAQKEWEDERDKEKFTFEQVCRVSNVLYILVHHIMNRF